jgi:excisionase family DNA binding protein
MLVKKQEGQQKSIGALMTVGEVATYLAVNERTVYRLIKEGHLPAYRVGGQWRFKVEMIDAWMRRSDLLEGANTAALH